MEWTIKQFQDLTLDELYAILYLRTAVFVVDQACPYQEVDNKDQESYHLLGQDNGDIVAYARLLPPGLSFPQASIGRVLVAPSHRGQGLGQQLMARSLAFLVEELGQKRIQLSGQTYLEAFYKSFGFQPISDMYLEDDIPHKDMLLVMED